MTDSLNPISRRLLLRRGAVVGLTAAVPGCLSESITENQIEFTEADIPAPGHQVYAVEAAEDERILYRIAPHLSPPVEVIVPAGWIPRPSRGDEPSSTYFLVWATAEEATKLQKNKRIGSVSVWRQRDIVVVGNENKAKGKLAVRLFPNTTDDKYDETTYEAIEEVVGLWHQQLASIRGFTIRSIQDEAHKNRGSLSRLLTGQVLFQFDGKLDSMVIDVVKSHPQTIAVKWGDWFRKYFCPPCGMG